MEAVYERYATHVQRVLTRVVGIDPVLPELLHDVFIEVFSHIHSIKNGDKLKGWLTSIAVFTARGYIRRRARRMTIWFDDFYNAPELPAVKIDHEIREALECTYEILDKLPADERIAFALRFMEGMDLSEIADASRVSLATVKRRLSRAQKKFLAKACQHVVLQEWIERGRRWRLL
jgi:RNA polymerase sigma-70 factor (ECF subfamily)